MGQEMCTYTIGVKRKPQNQMQSAQIPHNKLLLYRQIDQKLQTNNGEGYETSKQRKTNNNKNRQLIWRQTTTNICASKTN